MHPRRHRPRNGKPVPNLMAAIAGNSFKVFVASVALCNLGNVACNQAIEKLPIEFFIDLARRRRSDPVRQTASPEYRDPLVVRPAPDTRADECSNIKASL